MIRDPCCHSDGHDACVIAVDDEADDVDEDCGGDDDDDDDE